MLRERHIFARKACLAGRISQESFVHLKQFNSKFQIKTSALQVNITQPNGTDIPTVQDSNIPTVFHAYNNNNIAFCPKKLG
jgi:hypothetical protein